MPFMGPLLEPLGQANVDAFFYKDRRAAPRATCAFGSRAPDSRARGRPQQHVVPWENGWRANLPKGSFGYLYRTPCKREGHFTSERQGMEVCSAEELARPYPVLCTRTYDHGWSFLKLA